MGVFLYYLQKILYILPYVGLVVYVIRIIILKKAPVPKPKGKKLTNELLLSCIEQLKKHDKKQHDEYYVNQEIADRLNKDNRNPQTLVDLLHDIASHVEISGDLFILIINNAVVSDRAGYIRPGAANIKINLELKEEYDTDTIISVLAHEVMHQYLFFQGIKRSDNWENEILTDTAVVYCGFYQYMYRGYAPKHGVNPFAYSKVGYIGQNEIQFIKDNI